MFHFLYRKNDIRSLSVEEIKNYQIILTEIRDVLLLAKLFDYAGIIQGLLDLLLKQDIKKFVTELKSNDIWGGSGAVWEIDTLDNFLQDNFVSKMIMLIDLMKNTQLSNRNVNRIRMVFEKNHH